MAVYTEDANGVRTLVTNDKTLTDVVAEINATKSANNEEISPCIKDTLANTTIKVKEG